MVLLELLQWIQFHAMATFANLIEKAQQYVTTQLLRIWQGFVLIAVTYTLVCTPFLYAYCHLMKDQSTRDFFQTVDYVFGVFFALDFLGAIIGIVFLHQRPILPVLLRALAELPGPLRLFGVETFPDYALIYLLRILHILRFDVFRLREEELRRPGHQIHFLRWVLIYLYTIHVGGCLFFYASLYSTELGTWTSGGKPTAYFNRGIPYAYLVSIYWSIATLTSTGYGDVHAHTFEEIAFSTCFMLFCFLLSTDFGAFLVACHNVSKWLSFF